ncbi:hypothetical protein C9J19_20305 [Photobacterium phosphoreum]|uniref:hypothetical protein n=1 Tax=Photobacterium phosphoreum TaxID=659 RepID=UPI000D173C0D|nr:hypothetical protein [Photobacterium phosphoreum]PSW24307.1 hypothetical protein C9J19_20305 [Photobacterium phosphoreum]
MEITFKLYHVVDNYRLVKVSLYEIVNDKGESVDVEVWVKDSDSISEIELMAKNKVIERLKVTTTYLNSLKGI